MTFTTIAKAHDGRGVVTISLDRPDKHNALNADMIAELEQAAHDIAADASVRVVVLTGSGTSFCAGGDLEWMRAQMSAARDQRISEATKLARMLSVWNRLPQPVIGRIQGQAFGGGVGMMSVCDVAVAVDTARFGLTEVRLGLIPATISPYVVARLGEARARRVFMSGRRFTATEAVALGLVASAVPEADLDAAVEREIAPYLDASPEAVAAAKRLVAMLGPQIDDAVIKATAESLADCWETADAGEGIAAFFDRREPRWPSLSV